MPVKVEPQVIKQPAALVDLHRAWSNKLVELLTIQPEELIHLPGGPQAVSWGLAFLSRDKAEHFAAAYDTLRHAYHANQAAGGMYRNAVARFLQVTEGARLHAMDRTVHSKNIDQLRTAHAIASIIASRPLSATNRDLAEHQLIRLENKRYSLGDWSGPRTPPKTAPSSPHLKGVLEAVMLEDYHLKMKGGSKRVSRYFPEGFKEKYLKKLPGLSVKDSPVAFSRLHALDGSSGVYTMGRTFMFGGYGKVRVAIDDSGKAWAVKVFRLAAKGHAPRAKTQVSVEENVHDEIELNALMNSGMQIHETFAVEEKVYAVLPLMDCDLIDLCNAGLDDNTFMALIRRMFRDVSADLERCHSKGIIHRDIKPDNVLIERSTGMKLSDMGLASHDLEADAFEVKGTPGYFAPEVVLGTPFFDHYTDRADIFSLALMLAYTQATPKLCPFWIENEKHSDLHKHMTQAKQVYGAWRTRCGRDDNPKEIDWNEVALGATDCDLFALELYGRDADMADYIFNHMLQLDPNDRDNATEVAEAAWDFYSPDPKVEAALDKALYDVAQRVSGNDARIAELRKYHDEVITALAIQTPLPAPVPNEALALGEYALGNVSGARANALPVMPTDIPTPPNSKPNSDRSPSE